MKKQFAPHIIIEGENKYHLGNLDGNQIIYDFDKMLVYLTAKGRLLFGKNFRFYKEDRDTMYKLCLYFIKDEVSCAKYGIDINKGILLTGPVGCGNVNYYIM